MLGHLNWNDPTHYRDYKQNETQTYYPDAKRKPQQQAVKQRSYGNEWPHETQRQKHNCQRDVCVDLLSVEAPRRRCHRRPKRRPQHALNRELKAGRGHG